MIGKWIQRLIDRLRGKKKRVPVVPEPEPISEPKPNTFVWEPLEGSVRVSVPVAYWQWSLTVTSPSVHHTASLTPIQRGQVTTIKGGGDYWREKSLELDPAGRGAVVFFVNLNSRDPETGWTAAHWVIPDPRERTVIE